MSTSTQEEWVLNFSVQDTGIGIKPQDMGKLFKLFGKLKVHNDINQNGVGLGLTISQKLVEQLGGKIGVNSNEGKGTNFHFNIITQAKKQTKNIQIGQESYKTPTAYVKNGSFFLKEYEGQSLLSF